MPPLPGLWREHKRREEQSDRFIAKVPNVPGTLQAGPMTPEELPNLPSRVAREYMQTLRNFALGEGKDLYSNFERQVGAFMTAGMPGGSNIVNALEKNVTKPLTAAATSKANQAMAEEIIAHPEKQIRRVAKINEPIEAGKLKVTTSNNARTGGKVTAPPSGELSVGEAKDALPPPPQPPQFRVFPKGDIASSIGRVRPKPLSGMMASERGAVQPPMMPSHPVGPVEPPMGGGPPKGPTMPPSGGMPPNPPKPPQGPTNFRDLPATDKLKEVANTPRALMTTLDLPPVFRQGLGAVGAKPLTTARAFGKGVKAGLSEKFADTVKVGIKSRDTYDEAVKSGVAFTDLADTREEAFLHSLADRMPGVKQVVKASNRMHTTFLNEIRSKWYDDVISPLKAAGKLDEKTAKDMAEVVNTATGRGSIKSLERHMDTLATGIFSPRLMASRIQTLNPQYYAKLAPVARKEALKSLGSVVGTISGVGVIGKAAGAEVDLDPLSGDFAKVKINGKTRLDMTGGYARQVRLYARTINNIQQRIRGMEPSQDIVKEVGRYLRGSESPLGSFIHDMAEGKDFIGRNVDVTDVDPNDQKTVNPIINRLLPMITDDFMDLLKEDPRQLGLMIPSLVGGNVDVYDRSSRGNRPARTRASNTRSARTK